MNRIFSALLVVLSLQATSQPVAGVEIREAWITMRDGVRLAADLYVPQNLGPQSKLPVLLEYLPYRKDEGRRNRFGLFHYFVTRGYIVARVDIRGTGRSEGMLVPYEYSKEEQQDGEVVIDWLSRQAFSNGNVGMFGISWGGFNALHMAMRRPSALKAIVTLMSTDDIYQDDVHFIDGMMHVDAYEIGQDLANILPGAPDFTLDSDYFKNRFETLPWLLQYKRQQRDGSFWDRASLNSHYSKIDIPVFAIGGWYDGYRDAVFRMLDSLKSPMKAMIGPWNHTFPNWADPPPAIEWRAEAVRWFDQWLKGMQTGILDEPRLSVFIREGHQPGTKLDTIRGQWHHAQKLPTSSSQKFYFDSEKRLIRDFPRMGKKFSIAYKPSAGFEAGGSVMWWGDWSPDQRAGDSISLVFETDPLTEDVTILGFPRAQMQVSASASRANWFVRLSDVFPDGTVTLVTGAGANGSHAAAAESIHPNLVATYPQPIAPDSVFPLDIELHATSWIFRKGHRIRLSISNALWPMIWPTPYPFTSSLWVGSEDTSWLQLPVVTGAGMKGPDYQIPEEDPRLPGFATLASGTNSGFAEVAGLRRDAKKGTASVRMTNEDGFQYPWGKVYGSEEITHLVSDRDPAKASVTSRYITRVELSHRVLLFQGDLSFTSDKDYFYYTYTRTVTENGKVLRTKTWKERIPRDFQ